MQGRWSQLTRFVVAGAVNTAFSYAVYATGLWFGIAYPVANFISMVAGVCIGFVTQGRFVFRRFEWRRFPVFALTWVLLWGVNVALIRLVLPLVDNDAYAAGAAALVVMVVISFFVQKHLVFGETKQERCRASKAN